MPEAELLHLLKAAFGGDDTLPWPANQRWLLWSSIKLLGHVSVQRRWFVVNKQYFEGWFDGKLALDENPALAISFKQGFDVTALTCEAFPFGFDF